MVKFRILDFYRLSDLEFTDFVGTLVGRASDSMMAPA